MKDLVNKTAPAFSGSIEAVMDACVDRVEDTGGAITIKGITKGDNGKGIRVIATASDDCAKQVKVLVDEARAAGNKALRFQVFGPVEVDFKNSDIEGNPEKPLVLRVAATQVKPVHPDPKMDPTQNAVMLFGQVNQYESEIEFTHLDTNLQEGKSPARVKLSNASKEKVVGLKGTSVMVVGRFNQQTSLEEIEKADGSKIPPFDHISFAITDLMKIAPLGVPARMPSKAKTSGVISGYNAGFEKKGSAPRSEAEQKAYLDELDQISSDF